jgi:tight adherence protein B
MSNTQLLTAAFGVGLAVLLLSMGLYFWLNRRRLNAQRQLRERLGELTATNAASAAAILRGSEASHGLLDKLLRGRPYTAVVTEELHRSGVDWSAAQFTALVLAGIAIGVLTSLWLDPLLAIAIGVTGSVAPFIVLSIARHRRERKIEEQLPDAIDMLVNALKAGYSLQASMSFVGTELAAPLGPEFGRFFDEQRLGMDVRQALEHLHERLGTIDARMLVLALIIQRESGGNLAEILEHIAGTIRERIEFRGQVDVLTAESKLSAVVLGVLPLVMFLLVRISNAAYSSTLTTTTLGQQMIVYGIVSLIVGAIILRQMAQIEV